MNWRRWLGWFAVVLGTLIALFGLIAIAGADSPGVDDPNSARVGGVIFAAFGMAVAAGGAVLLFKAAKIPRRPRDQAGRWGIRTLGAVFSLLVVTCFGIGALVYSLSLDASVHDFQSAVPCTPTGSSNCYQVREVAITSVDVSRNDRGETDTVHFDDGAVSREVSIHPGDRDSSVLHAGAGGTAVLWRGRYTNLKVAGTDFATLDNPAGQQGEWRVIAYITLGSTIFYAFVIGAAFLARRRKAVPSQPQVVIPAGQVASYPGLPLLIRPLPFSKRASPIVWLALPAIVLVVFLMLAPSGIGVQVAGAGSLALVFAVLIGWSALVGRNAGLFVDEIEFGTIDGFGRRRSWPRGDAARILITNVVDARRRATPMPWLIVLGPDGRTRVRAMVRLYGAEGIAQFTAALGVPVDEDPTPITASDLERRVPGSASWLVVHATGVGVGIAVGLIVIGMFVAVAVGGSFSAHH
jgi:hypothetical protein